MNLICSAEAINHNNVSKITEDKRRPKLVKIKLNRLVASFITSSYIMLTVFLFLETPLFTLYEDIYFNSQICGT